jgi:MoaA/NifB/PqqE/SkfB family radical SAM enzyme
MTVQDWLMVIDQAAQMGTNAIQLIGGEPTMSPVFPALLTYALDSGMRVEVFTNLTHVSPALWSLFVMPGVQLAVSYYSDRAAEHDAVTKVPGSHARTRGNIVNALALGVPLRLATVEILPGQRVLEAQVEMAALGVPKSRVDRMRRVGRGDSPGGIPETGELCGYCGDYRAAVSPDGDVTPCVMGRWLVTGNIKRQRLAAIFDSEAWRDALTQIPGRPAGAACGPGDGAPDICGPQIGCKPS